MRIPEPAFQERIINTLLNSFSKAELVGMMQSHLHFSKATCYKYINCTTDISYNQMSVFLEISQVKEVINQESLINPGVTKWFYPPFINGVNTHIYLDSLQSYLKLLDSSDAKIIMTTYEIPIFYYMYFPSLFAFKLFCWSKTIWMESEFYSEKFDLNDILKEDIVNIIQELCDRYHSIQAVEYWTTNMVSNTIRQIMYFRDTDRFKNITQIRKLIQDLKDLTGLMQSMSESGQKRLADKVSLGAKAKIYQNDIYYTNNLFIVKSTKLNYVFSSFDNPNYILSSDPRIIQKTLQWIKDMDRHCESLSETNEIARNQFFEQLYQAIDILEF